MSIIMFLKKRHKERVFKELCKELSKSKAELDICLKLIDANKQLAKKQDDIAKDNLQSFISKPYDECYLKDFHSKLDTSWNYLEQYYYYTTKYDYLKNKITHLEEQLKNPNLYA